MICPSPECMRWEWESFLRRTWCHIMKSSCRLIQLLQLDNWVGRLSISCWNKSWQLDSSIGNGCSVSSISNFTFCCDLPALHWLVITEKHFVKIFFLKTICSVVDMPLSVTRITSHIEQPKKAEIHSDLIWNINIGLEDPWPSKQQKSTKWCL